MRSAILACCAAGAVLAQSTLTGGLSLRNPVIVGVSSGGGGGGTPYLGDVGGGFYFAHAIKSDGTAYGWGVSGVTNYGQIGDGATSTRLTPTQTTGSGWRSIDSGANHTLAVKSD